MLARHAALSARTLENLVCMLSVSRGCVWGPLPAWHLSLYPPFCLYGSLCGGMRRGRAAGFSPRLFVWGAFQKRELTGVYLAGKPSAKRA